MTYKLGKDGWPTDETVVDMRDREIESLRQQLADIKREWSIADSHKEDYAEKLERQLAECQAWKDDVVNMIATEVKTARKQWQREALLDAADYVDTFAISNDTPVTEIAWHIRNMAKELE